ncbi:MAG: hypothetical protein ACFFAS_01535 [Promethearchaeota archaeon]
MSSWHIISKGISKKNYYDLLLEKNNIGIESDLQLHSVNNNHSSLARELTHILLNSDSPSESFNNISKLIILILCIPNGKCHANEFFENKQRLVEDIYYEFQDILKIDQGKSINSYFELLQKVASFIQEQKNLKNQQKLDYCTIERLLMKSYLKDIHSRCL